MEKIQEVIVPSAAAKDNRRDHRGERPTCVVTGVAGFVGSHLAHQLLAMGAEVIGVDNFFSGKRENLKPLLDSPRFVFYQQSITEPDLLLGIEQRHPNVSICFHLAAIVSVPYSVDHPDECRQVNHEATIALLDQARRLGLDSFVFAGSAAEYGTESRLPLLETYATEQTVRLSPYGEYKFSGSRAVASHGAHPRGVALRCFNIYGPRQDPSSPYSGVISRFLRMALEGAPLTIFGDGHQTRDFIYVADVVSAYLTAAGLVASNRQPEAGVYNVGSGGRLSVLRLAKTIQGLTDHRKSISFYPERAGDVRHSQADIHRFVEATGWQAEVGFEEGLRRTIDWMRSC